MPGSSRCLGQVVVIDNKAGATGIIGTDFVAKAAADGYTLALVVSSHGINASMKKVLPFDTLTGFEPVIQIHSATHEARQAMADLVLENLDPYFNTGTVRVAVP